MGGEEGGKYSVLPNGITAVCLTAKVKTPCDRRLREFGRKKERDIQRESWDLSTVGEVKVSRMNP